MLKLYHGTNSKFKKFRTDKIGSATGDSTYGWGIYLYTDYDVAVNHAKVIGAINGRFIVHYVEPTRTLKTYHWEDRMDKNLCTLICQFLNRRNCQIEELEKFLGCVEDSYPTLGSFYDYCSLCLGDKMKVSKILYKLGVDGIISTPYKRANNYTVLDSRLINIVHTEIIHS